MFSFEQGLAAIASVNPPTTRKWADARRCMRQSTKESDPVDGGRRGRPTPAITAMENRRRVLARPPYAS